MLAEDLLIRFCARVNTDRDIARKIKEILTPDLNWAYFLQKTKDEGVCSLIHKTLSKIQDVEKILPENVLQNLKNNYYSTAKRNILIFQTLEKISQTFEKENIQMIVFKGIALAESVYGDIGLRPMGDIDILVKKKDLEKVDSIFKNFGYHTPFDIRDFINLPFNRYRNSFLYSNLDTTPNYVHLYWHLINFFPYHSDVIQRINMDKIWEDSEEIKLGDAKLRTFSIYHQIIFLCMHALHHSPKSLIRLCDINELLQLEEGNLDWDKLVREAFDFGLHKHVYYVLYSIFKLLEADIPDNTLKMLRPEKMSFFERKFISSVLEWKPMFHGELLVYLGMNETLRERVLFLCRVLFPSRNELALIRQKSIAKVNFLDYLKRVNSGLDYAVKALFKYLT